MAPHSIRHGLQELERTFKAPEGVKPMTAQICEIPVKLQSPIRSLARVAHLFRGVFVQAAEGRAISRIISERQEALVLAEKVLDAWWSHLRLDTEEIDNGSDG